MKEEGTVNAEANLSYCHSFTQGYAIPMVYLRINVADGDNPNSFNDKSSSSLLKTLVGNVCINSFTFLIEGHSNLIRVFKSFRVKVFG